MVPVSNAQFTLIANNSNPQNSTLFDYVYFKTLTKASTTHCHTKFQKHFVKSISTYAHNHGKKISEEGSTPANPAIDSQRTTGMGSCAYT